MGLGMAGRQPDRIANIVITNTWAWDLPEDDDDGLYHALINWGNTALEVGDSLTESCLVPRNNSQGIALAYDPDQGELYDRVLKRTVQPGLIRKQARHCGRRFANQPSFTRNPFWVILNSCKRWKRDWLI
jgi:hypothetical protein